MSPDRDKVSDALSGLAEPNAIGIDELLAYHDDSRWLVRFSAALAAARLPRSDVLPKVHSLVRGAAEVSPDLAIFCARVLSAKGDMETLSDLQ